MEEGESKTATEQVELGGGNGDMLEQLEAES